MPGRVLCVDPDGESRAATAAALREATDQEVTECRDLGSAVGALDAAVDCVVSEFELPDGTGLDLLAEARARTPDAGFVLFTDADIDDIDTERLGGEIAEYVPKGSPGARARLGDLVAHTVRSRTQTAYPVPDDETERLGALERYRPVLGAVEPAFDRLTTLAGSLLSVPVATLGIIDEHEQSYVACYGFDPIDLPRERTVCTYTILEDGVTTIEDLREDPRFGDNEALEAFDLRSYASADLTTPDGRVIGTVCVFDHDPRVWTDEDRDHLRLVAAEAMELLELHRRLHEAGMPHEPFDERRTVATPAGIGSPDEETPDEEEP